MASFFDTRARLAEHVATLQNAGHQIVSTWLMEHPGASYAGVTEGYRLACGLVDKEEISRAALFILDTIDESPRGGREVEFGIALAQGIPVIIVGPMRNVFHRLAFRHFEEWSKALSFIGQVNR